MWQVHLAFVSVANQSTASNLSDYQLSQVGFVQPGPGKLLCPIKSCGHRHAQPKALYKHCRRKSDALHKKLAVAFGGRSCDFCHEDFKRLYDWERHMRKTHKSSPPVVEGLTPSHLSPPKSSTPQPTGLQLQQRNAKINLALSDRRSSQWQAPLLPDNRFQHCSNRASLHQHCRSGVGHRDPWVETSAYTGYTKVLQTGDLESNEESYTHSGRADTYITAGLAREDNFNRLSVPLCQYRMVRRFSCTLSMETFPVFTTSLYGAKVACGTMIPMDSVFSM